jgi:peptidoglycan/LPS O-acetylase OafA/YrhL
MKAFRPDIEGLRALSIMLVVAYHYAGGWLPGGFVGVDVFFVISGYLITHSLLDQQLAGQPLHRSLFEFWARRARRLLPNALLVLVVTAALGALFAADDALSRLGSDVTWASAYAINWLFALRSVDYLRWGETDTSALLNYWSLAVEEQFYLLWPVLLLSVWRRAGSGARALPVAVGMGLALALLSLAYTLWLSRGSLTLAFFSAPARAWELLTGAVLALQLRRVGGWPLALGSAPAWFGLVAVVGAAGLMSQSSPHPGLVTLVPVLGTVLLLGDLGHPGVPANNRLRRWLGSAPMRALGARSYSLYLWHWPVLVLGQGWLPRDLAAGKWLLLAVSLLLAELAYRGIESPARWRWLRGAGAGRVLMLALGGSAAVVAVGLALRGAAESSLRAGAVPAAPRGAAGLPPLHRVKNDLPVVYANGCHLGLEPAEPASGCRLGGTANAPAVLVFGDSHAAQWVPALQAAAELRGHSVIAWTKSSCPSADVTVWVGATRSVYRECDTWRETVLDRIASLRPALVLVSNLIDDETVVVDRSDAQLLHGLAASAAFEAGLMRTLARLQATGVPVVLMRDTPRPRRDVLDCLYSTPDPARCARPRAEALVADPMDVRAARRTAVPVWDLSDRICDATNCPAAVPMANGLRVVYRDDNHLTASFAATLGPALLPMWPAASGTAR